MKFYKIFHYLFITLIIISSAKPDPKLPYSSDLQRVLDSTRSLCDIKGISASVIRTGYAPWTGVSGYSHGDVKITPDMLFDMGSIGKFVTSILVLKLCEDGLLSLDDRVDKYLQPYPNVDGAITVRQLLNHTSGLYDMVPHPNGPFRVPYNKIDFNKWWTIEEIFTELGGKPYFKSGEGFHYTQAGYQLASLIIEKVTGSSVADELQKRILNHLKIKGMLLDFKKPVPEGFVIGHPWVDEDSDGIPEDVNSYSRNWIASLSRILYYTNAEDLALLTHSLFSGKVLKDSSLDEMLNFVHPKKEELGGPLIVDYGLGVMDINPQLLNGQRALGHLGSIPGYRAFTGYFRDLGVTIVILYNSDTDEAFPVLSGLIDTVMKNAE